MLRTLLVAVAVLATGAPAALAGPVAPLRLRDTGVTPTIVRGDGVRRLAMAVGGGAVSVLDTRSQAFSLIPTPAGCTFADIHRATLLWNCPSTRVFPTGSTYDMATGAVTTLPPLVPGGGTEGARYAAIGEHFARMDLDGYHYFNTYMFVERATGRQSVVHARSGHIRDLDAPRLTRRLCAGHIEPIVWGGIGLEPGEPVAVGRWTAAMTTPHESNLARVQIQRCGSARARTIRVCRMLLCSEPVLDDRIVAWTEQRPVRPYASRLVVRWLRSGRVRRTPWRMLSLRPVLVDHRLYVHEEPAPPEPSTGRGRLLRVRV